MNSFSFNDTASTRIYTLSLHDALPIYREGVGCVVGLGRLGQRQERAHHPLHLVLRRAAGAAHRGLHRLRRVGDRKSTRLNSSHSSISYAVFCLKKKTAPSSASLADSFA